MARPARRSIGIVAGVAALAVGAAIGATRTVARRNRSNADPDAGSEMLPPFDRDHHLPSHDGGTIHVIERGSGPTIVLSHGVTLSVRTWVKQMEALPELGFRVVAFDHRGHGSSTVGEQGHTIDTLAWDVRSVLVALNLRDAVVVGHSLGGVAAQSFCIRFPEVAAERVAGIVLLSTLSRSPLAASNRWNSLLAALANRLPDASGALAAHDLGFALTRLGFGSDPQPRHIELTREMIVACPPETRRRAPGALLGLDLTADLPRIAVPVLVACGSADVLTPPDESRRIVSHLPQSQLEIIEGAGHMVMLERAAELDRLIVDFAHSVQGISPADVDVSSSQSDA